jgi:hypothetical protein
MMLSLGLFRLFQEGCKPFGSGLMYRASYRTLEAFSLLETFCRDIERMMHQLVSIAFASTTVQ